MKKIWKIIIAFFLSVAIFFLIINIIPFKKAVNGNNPFIQGKTLIAAHRGGKELNPENTMKAFKRAVMNYKVDILELDLCLTKDNELVVIHNLYINDHSDVELVTGKSDIAYVEDFTYSELQQFNFGYNFKLNDKYIYRNIVTLEQENREEIIKYNDLNIVKFSDLVKEFYESYPNLMYIVEIKNDEEKGKVAVDELLNIINSYPNLETKLVASSYFDENLNYLKEKNSNIMLGASLKKATSFIISEMFKVSLFNHPSYYCLQIPTSYSILKLDKKSFIKTAHEKNIAIQYWTINDKETMKKLINLGVDCIMTDNPELLLEVMKEMGLK